MAGDEVTVIQLCSRCRAELGTISVRKENMMLSSRKRIRCPHCGTETRELREVAGRADSIREELASYPENTPVG